MNRYPAWKNLLILSLVLVGLFVAVPNLYSEDPAVQVSRDDGTAVGGTERDSVELALSAAAADFSEVYLEDGSVIVRLADYQQQTQAGNILEREFERGFVVALTSAPRTPGWLRALGLKPMSLGLDLRGGVHFLYEVDVDKAVEQRLDAYRDDISKRLRDERIQRTVTLDDAVVRVRVGDERDLERAEQLVRDVDANLDVRRGSNGELLVSMTEEQVRDRRDFAIQQNTVTLRNRVNELGVAEPLVQRQGASRIVVQLPGVRDPSAAKDVLSATATLEFRMVCEGENPQQAQQRGRAPAGCQLFSDRDGQPVLLKRRTIVTGDQLIDATSSFSQGQPAVLVDLDSKGARRMLETTKANLGKPMAVVFVETKLQQAEQNGETVKVPVESKEVINVATIRGVFSNSFQITGLSAVEAPRLALLLRAGALAAPIFQVEERTIGPSLGQDNIDRGFRAVVIGLALVMVFMVVYYRGFGLVADLALVTNLALLIALLSMLQASLTLPGIAGIVLTVGMAVDANVLIFERIREELRNGNAPQESIQAGYDKALSTIADANVTTLIAAIVLFVFGTGPIKGFAVTLSLGILTSMFTAILGTRAVVNAAFGGRKLERLPIGGT